MENCPDWHKSTRAEYLINALQLHISKGKIEENHETKEIMEMQGRIEELEYWAERSGYMIIDSKKKLVDVLN